MRKIIYGLLLCVGIVAVSNAQIVSQVVTAACTAFGTTTGTCAQGGVITAGGPTGSATVVPVITYNAAGQLTAVTTAATGVTTVGTAAVGQIPGTTTNDDAAAGKVGEIILSTIASGSAVSLATGATANITSITLTAGDWDVTGAFAGLSNVGTNITYISTSISTTSATNDSTPGRLALESYQPSGVVPSGVQINISLPTTRITVASGTQVVYLTANCAFSVSTLSAFGIIRARRMR